MQKLYTIDHAKSRGENHNAEERDESLYYYAYECWKQSYSNKSNNQVLFLLWIGFTFSYRFIECCRLNSNVIVNTNIPFFREKRKTVSKKKFKKMVFIIHDDFVFNIYVANTNRNRNTFATFLNILSLTSCCIEYVMKDREKNGTWNIPRLQKNSYTFLKTENVQKLLEVLIK